MGLFGKELTVLNEGDKIPSFELLDQDGNLFSWDTHKGTSSFVIFFYPKDDTPGCTKEACSFRDEYEVFQEAGVQVLGINSGSPESHKKFQTKHRLPYLLLSDPGNKVAHTFGVKNVLFLTGRETFVVNKAGELVYKFRNLFQAEDHVKNTLGMLAKLK